MSFTFKVTCLWVCLITFVSCGGKKTGGASAEVGFTDAPAKARIDSVDFDDLQGTSSLNAAKEQYIYVFPKSLIKDQCWLPDQDGSDMHLVHLMLLPGENSAVVEGQKIFHAHFFHGKNLKVLPQMVVYASYAAIKLESDTAFLNITANENNWIKGKVPIKFCTGN